MSAIAESAPALNNEVPDGAKTRTCGALASGRDAAISPAEQGAPA